MNIQLSLPVCIIHSFPLSGSHGLFSDLGSALVRSPRESFPTGAGRDCRSRMMDGTGATWRSDVLLECVGVGSGSRKFIAPRCCTQKRSKDNESIFHMLDWVYLGIPEYCTEKEMKGWGRTKKILRVKYFCDLRKNRTLCSEQSRGGTLRAGLMCVIKHRVSCRRRKTGKVTDTALRLIIFISS